MRSAFHAVHTRVFDRSIKRMSACGFESYYARMGSILRPLRFGVVDDVRRTFQLAISEELRR